MANFKDVKITSTGYFKVPSGNSSQAPDPAPMGMLRYDTDKSDIRTSMEFSEYRGYPNPSQEQINGFDNYLGVPRDGLVVHLDYNDLFLADNQAVLRSSINLASMHDTTASSSQSIGSYTNSNGSTTYFLNFDGNANKSFLLYESSHLNMSKDQTINFFIKPATRTAGRRENFYNQAYGGDGTITLEPSGYLNYFYGISGTDAASYQGIGTDDGAVPVGIDPNEWQMFTVVRDLENMTVKWYKNAVEIYSVAATYSYAKPTTNNITIGDGYTNPYTGGIGMISVWREALTSDDITDMFNTFRHRYDL